jgi:hypothetical protein
VLTLLIAESGAKNTRRIPVPVGGLSAAMEEAAGFPMAAGVAVQDEHGRLLAKVERNPIMFPLGQRLVRKLPVFPEDWPRGPVGAMLAQPRKGSS